MKVSISFVRKDKMLIKLLEPINYISSDKTHRVKVPKGYITDGGSIPKVFWSILSPFEDHFTACAIHDYLCDLAISVGKESVYMHRLIADEAFYDSMSQLKVKLSTKLTLYTFVVLARIFRYNKLSIKLFGMPELESYNAHFFNKA